jgi:hypothetical protein
MFASRISARTLFFVITQQSRLGYPPNESGREVGPFGGLSKTCEGFQ